MGKEYAMSSLKADGLLRHGLDREEKKEENIFLLREN